MRRDPQLPGGGESVLLVGKTETSLQRGKSARKRVECLRGGPNQGSRRNPEAEIGLADSHESADFTTRKRGAKANEGFPTVT